MNPTKCCSSKVLIKFSKLWLLHAKPVLLYWLSQLQRFALLQCEDWRNLRSTVVFLWGGISHMNWSLCGDRRDWNRIEFVLVENSYRGRPQHKTNRPKRQAITELEWGGKKAQRKKTTTVGEFKHAKGNIFKFHYNSGLSNCKSQKKKRIQCAQYARLWLACTC